MSIIIAEVEEIEMEGDEGGTIPGLAVTCSHCGHSVEVFGTSEASAKRGAVMLREECPEGKGNFYKVEGYD